MTSVNQDASNPDRCQKNPAGGRAGTHNGNRSQSDYQHNIRHCFGLFGIFFVFYVSAAVIQTPTCVSFASIRLSGVPLGLVLSMLIFPVSWILIALYFAKGR